MSHRRSVVAGIALLALATVPAAAQVNRFEVVPEYGYTFGGGFNFPANFFTGISSGGKLVLDASSSFGATIGYEGHRGTYFTISYVYQGTQIGVDWNQTPPPSSGVDPNAKGDIGLHKVLFGGRQEFIKSSKQAVRPYIGGGLGFVVLDPNFVTARGTRPSSQTEFTLSLDGGLRYMVGDAKRFGIQGDFKGSWFWVPSGDLFMWCDPWWGCTVSQGTRTIAQGTVSVGAIIKF